MNTPRVGQNVDSWCTRCKLMLAHTVEAVVGAKVTRVHCNTCRSQHAYRAHPPGQGGSAGARRATGAGRSARSGRGSKPATPQASDYLTLIQGRDASRARPYSVQGRFAPKELIRHPTFGLGLVTSSKDGTKIEVLFSDGPKTLVHGR